MQAAARPSSSLRPLRRHNKSTLQASRRDKGDQEFSSAALRNSRDCKAEFFMLLVCAPVRVFTAEFSVPFRFSLICNNDMQKFYLYLASPHFVPPKNRFSLSLSLHIIVIYGAALPRTAERKYYRICRFGVFAQPLNGEEGEKIP